MKNALISVSAIVLFFITMVSYADMKISPDEIKFPDNSTQNTSLTGSAAAASPCFDSLERYEDCGNGTLTDSVTGLIWLKNANCFGQLNYKEAQDQVANLKHGDCGLTDNSSPGDWRLPTIEEWDATAVRAKSLVCTSPALTDASGYNCYSEAGRTQMFNGVQLTYYWLTTTHEDSPTNAWTVYLVNGDTATANKTTTFPVWPVRAGK